MQNPKISQTPKKRKIELSVIVVQVNSFLGEPSKTYTKKIKKMLEVYKGQKIDLIVLPEMALTGYDFASREQAEALSEVQGKGISFLTAKKIARDFNSYVVIGYPERVENAHSGPTLYNSAYILGREGQLLQNYRKILLYTSDKKFYSPGREEDRPVVELVTVNNDRLRLGVGICMDINYKDFEDFYQFPLAEYLRDQKIDILAFPTAWTEEGEDPTQRKSDAEERSDLYNYWTMRVLPALSRRWRLDREVGKRREAEWVMVAADRCGDDNGVTHFKGLSGVIGFNRSECKAPFECDGGLGLGDEAAQLVRTWLHK